MISAINAAKYIASVYSSTMHEHISEMKLHKLMYYSQKESLIMSDKILFPEEIQGRQFGPVIPSILYDYSEICKAALPELDAYSKYVLDEVLRRYGEKDQWSLSRLSRGEYSWQRSRKGVIEDQPSANVMQIDDIRIDAQRTNERRQILKSLQLV